MKTKIFLTASVLALMGSAFAWSCAQEEEGDTDFRTLHAPGGVSGAIFTTLVDGSRVNANLYEQKEDVYLDGGPGPNAPATAAGLPEGDYYYQVTDPSGKDLLSSDHITCRKVHVNEAGVIDQIYTGQNWVWDGGWQHVPCLHDRGSDTDHSDEGALTVQLFPYDDTPNKGGVYKVWMTPEDAYIGDLDLAPHGGKKADVAGEHWEPGNFHGFVPSESKTDNYKVQKKGKPYIQPTLSVLKFHDANINGVKDEGEVFIDSWGIAIADPEGGSNSFWTPVLATVYEGLWVVLESEPVGTLQTVAFLDGEQQSIYPDADPLVVVDVLGDSEETHEVLYGDVGLGKIAACKRYDRNANGAYDEGEPGVSGWRVELTGTDLNGATVGPLQRTTGVDGCTVFTRLLPGTYTVTETMPTAGDWEAIGETTATVTIESLVVDNVLVGTRGVVNFTNVCKGTADFNTKGYWHNKNGLTEMTDEDIDEANQLAPYTEPSSYFGAGDEPFDGTFYDGKPVAPAKGEAGEELAPGGSARAEVSAFLIDANAGGDPREQLAQQLLAFFFNTRHALDNPAGGIQLPDGTWTSGLALIEQAITAWQSGDDEEQNEIQGILDGLNNNDAVPVVHWDPCEVTY
jgi:hypothetical protein